MSDVENEQVTRADVGDPPTSGYTLPQRLVAEFVGTFTLLFVTIGSIIAAHVLSDGAGGAGLVTVAIAYGLAVATMSSAVGHVSGGHFNPAVTVATWITGKTETVAAFLYVVVQLAGAVAGAGLIRLALPEEYWKAVKLGTPLLNSDFTVGQGLIIEGVLTFFVVWVIFATSVDGSGAFSKVAGLAVGFAVIMGVMAGGPFTGAAMNPARSFGPALAGGYWSQELLYWVGPLAGAAIAGLLYELVVLRPRRG